MFYLDVTSPAWETAVNFFSVFLLALCLYQLPCHFSFVICVLRNMLSFNTGRFQTSRRFILMCAIAIGKNRVYLMTVFQMRGNYMSRTIFKNRAVFFGWPEGFNIFFETMWVNLSGVMIWNRPEWPTALVLFLEIGNRWNTVWFNIWTLLKAYFRDASYSGHMTIRLASHLLQQQKELRFKRRQAQSSFSTYN